MKFEKKKPKKEVFLGALRATVDQDTESFLRAHIPEDVNIRNDGMIITKFPNGRIEFETVYQRCMRMVNEIKGRKKNAVQDGSS